MNGPSIAALWEQAGGGTPQFSQDRYRELMLEHGHITHCDCPCHSAGSGHCEACAPQLPCGWQPGTEGQ
jgi:hypothetical protein